LAFITSAVVGLYLIIAGSVDLEEFFSIFKAIEHGSLIGIANTLLAARSIRQSSRAVVLESSKLVAIMPVYMGLLNRLLLTGSGVWLGLVILGLNPMFMGVGYIIVQIVFLGANARILNTNNNTIDF